MEKPARLTVHGVAKSWTRLTDYFHFHFLSMKNVIENRPMDMGGGEELEGEMYGESKMETYNNTYKIDS